MPREIERRIQRERYIGTAIERETKEDIERAVYIIRERVV